jgi:MFS family permease
MLVQLSSLPVALSLPTLSKYFDTSIDDAAWVVIVYLLVLGSLVLLAARLGDRFGHNRVFFIGIVASTAGSVLIAFAQDLWQIVMWRGVTGLGSALIMGNANAILAANFAPEERGRAFAIPIIGARFGTLTGLAVFSLFLNYLSWRFIFASFVPLGVLAIFVAIPMLRHKEQPRAASATGPIDWLGGLLLVGTAVVLVLSATHLHGGEESFVSSDGLGYHVPMHLLFIALAVAFVIVEIRARNPVVPMGHFKQMAFTTSLGSNVVYHGSMLAVMTLVPILVEEGFGLSPLFVIVVLLPNQALGLFMPIIAGWIWDKHQPKFLRPATMAMIAGGFLLLGLLSSSVSIWVIPLLLLPISIGTNIFNPINNAAVMNSLALEHRGIASGMLETTRELGHALGATAAAAALTLALPVGIELLSDDLAQTYYVRGFEVASLLVVFTLLFGAVLTYFHKSSVRTPPAAEPNEPSLQPGGDD